MTAATPVHPHPPETSGDDEEKHGGTDGEEEDHAATPCNCSINRAPMNSVKAGGMACVTS